MNKTGSILKTLQAVLLVTVLTPAISHADPLSTRMMLAQAQTQSQDQAVKGEVKKLNRGLILGTAEAATPSNVQRPVEIPQVAAPVAPTAPTPTVATVEAPQIEIPALPSRNDDAPVAPVTNDTYATAAAPAVTSTTANSSVVTLPAPQPTDTAAIVTTPATTDAATTPAVTPVEPATAVATPAPTATATTTDTAKTDAVKTNTAKADTTTAKPTSTRTAQASHPHHASEHGDDSINVAGVKLNGGNLSGQINKIINRSDVKSILSQYGLN